MALSKRIIARLDVKGNKIIKGVRFEGLRVIGDPLDMARKYAKAGIDELLYIDAVASLYGRNSLIEVLKSTSSEVFIPITAGGGIRNLEDAKLLLSNGADKIAINTAALECPQLISELSNTLGSQCVVVSIQARASSSSSWDAMKESGREKSGIDVIKWIENVQLLGAGEILLTSVDQDGTCIKPDEILIQKVLPILKLPLIVSGGFSDPNQVYQALTNSRISAVAIGAALHYQKTNVSDIKSMLSFNNIAIRKTKEPAIENNHYLNKNNKIVGIIDYGMGNHQSLINALHELGYSSIVSHVAEELNNCELIALPGVGAFAKGMDNLRRMGLDQYLINACNEGRPLIGICLGMQLLFESSEEYGINKGLGLLNGCVSKMQEHFSSKAFYPLPHMGWNLIESTKLAKDSGLSENSFYQYFVHSYSVKPKSDEIILHTCEYAENSIVASVLYENICGLQFHPERSGEVGINLLDKILEKLTSGKDDQTQSL